VGDLLHIEAGDIVPVDAILVEGQDVSCDESSATGESRTIRKVSAKTALENEDLAAGDIKNCDPFILSGAKVLEGVGNCLVTAVGTNSCYGRMMSCILQIMAKVLTVSISRRAGRHTAPDKTEPYSRHDCQMGKRHSISSLCYSSYHVHCAAAGEQLVPKSERRALHSNSYCLS